jgi:hypothetical protein
MAQVIIYTNSNGGVAVTVPTGEIAISEVLAKDCPQGAIIVDDSELPQDKEFFDAWELINGIVIVNEVKKLSIQSEKQTEKSIKESALSKLNALGLTSEEVEAILGVA